MKRIEMFAKEKGVSVSSLFVMGVMAMVNRQKPVPCSFCRNTAIGEYKIVSYDWSEGETSKEVNLCEFHLKKAKSETELHEL